MSTEITQKQTPEERELARKRSQLAALEARLAERELELATFKAELNVFESRYVRIVGIRYAELDDVEAQIAEAQARLNPDEKEAQKRSAQARARAEESAQASQFAEEASSKKRFRPSEKLKRLYREVAKAIHPDLATDEKERVRREKLMAEANRAYEEGDEARLEEILREWESSPEAVKGEGTGVELVRIVRKIAQVEQRMHDIEKEIVQLKQSELYQLKRKVEEAEEAGRDLLAEMAAKLDEQIADARRRLANTTQMSS
ncbi:molecular chaperone DnaJ [Acidobacteria bacterium AH-259-A15]|nr:molecular chaperone DnaJ [Acidobacteria bacterium AH-259-A15]